MLEEQDQEGGNKGLLSLLKERLERTQEGILAALRRAGRNPDEVRLIVVTKRFPLTVIAALVHLGVRRLGENYVRELAEKSLAYPELEWHLIGHVQSRYLRRLAPLLVESQEGSHLWVHTVDSLELLERMERLWGKLPPFLIQVNVGREPQKSGIKEEELLPLGEAILKRYPQAPFLGLMTIPPYRENPEEERGFYRRLRELRDEVEKQLGLKGLGLSMGMSHDYPVAIEEGATWVRIGQAILGPRE